MTNLLSILSSATTYDPRGVVVKDSAGRTYNGTVDVSGLSAKDEASIMRAVADAGKQALAAQAAKEASESRTGITGGDISLPGGLSLPLPTIPTIEEESDVTVLGSRSDTRIRLRVDRGTGTGMERILGPNRPSDNVLSILHETRGLLFPYTPTISVSQTVGWDPIQLVQTNWDVHAYQRTPSANISINGVFTAQTQREGEYLMAVLHFLRVVSKGYYGVDDSAAGLAGIAPPVLYLDGYGDFMFKSLPCVVKSSNYSFEEGMDTNLFTARTGQTARLPAKMTISIELGMQVNVNRQRTEFSLDKFRTGKLLSEGGGWF